MIKCQFQRPMYPYTVTQQSSLTKFNPPFGTEEWKMKNLLGGIQLEEFKGLTSMPQKAASAWVAVEGGITGAGYKPLLYVGTQVTKGITHWFIAEQTIIYKDPERHIVKIAINEFNKKVEGEDDMFETEYKLVPHSIGVIF